MFAYWMKLIYCPQATNTNTIISNPRINLQHTEVLESNQSPSPEIMWEQESDSKSGWVCTRADQQTEYFILVWKDIKISVWNFTKIEYWKIGILLNRIKFLEYQKIGILIPTSVSVYNGTIDQKIIFCWYSDKRYSNWLSLISPN